MSLLNRLQSLTVLTARKYTYCMNCRCNKYVIRPFKTFVQNDNFPSKYLNLSLPNNYNHVGNSSVVRAFHISSPKSALPPIVLLLIRPLAKLSAIIIGHTMRWWWRTMPQGKKTRVLKRIKRKKYFLLALLGSTVGGSIYFYLNHLEEDPVSGRKRFIIFSEEQMVQLAELTEETVIEEYKKFILPSTHPHYHRIIKVIYKLLQSNLNFPGIKDNKWKIVVIDNLDIKNTFVLANRSIFVFTGMLSQCTNDDQLGIILAHEIAHVVLRHMAERLSSVNLVELLLFLPILVVWAIVPHLGAILIHWLSNNVADLFIHLRFSRRLEFEADELGLTLAAKACMDVREASAFWKKMQILSEARDEDNFEWLSTHPSYETRHQVLESFMPAAMEIRNLCKCPKLPVADPRVAVAFMVKPQK